jgi:hypothetical protein
VKQLQDAYRDQIRASALRRFVFLDETGCYWATGPRGGADYSGAQFTLVAALGWNGIQAPLVFEGPMTGSIFETYVTECLVPILCHGDIVVMDNLSTHKRSAIQAAIEARGARLAYLPP